LGANFYIIKFADRLEWIIGIYGLNKLILSIMSVVPQQTIERRLRVDRKEIAFLRFIFEAYEGIANLTTLNAREGLIRLQIAPGCEGEVKRVLDNLKQEIMIEAI
jgi:hypothetical protein